VTGSLVLKRWGEGEGWHLSRDTLIHFTPGGTRAEPVGPGAHARLARELFGLAHIPIDDALAILTRPASGAEGP
jgi:hypothetical protein